MNTDKDGLRKGEITELVIKAYYTVYNTLMNFGPKPQFERKIYDNPLKGSMRWLPRSTQ